MVRVGGPEARRGGGVAKTKVDKKVYERELERMQDELVLLQEALRADGLRVVVVFEGRDTAGKGGTIKRITERLNPRVVSVVALGVPDDRERGQWYFQRYVERMPTSGEMVLFDRSWYNRGGVERVMGFCSEEDVQEFFRSAPELERMLVRSGIVLVKYWLEVGAQEQLERLLERVQDPAKQWKLSPIDAEAPTRYDDYTAARDEMFARTGTAEAPWYCVDANDQRRARLNTIAHLLELLPQRRAPEVVKIKEPRRPAKDAPLPSEGVVLVPERW
jgi:polyphosphate kinase 2